MSRSVSSITHRKRKLSTKAYVSYPVNQYVNDYLAALQENKAGIPKVFVDNQRYETDLKYSPNQAQIWFTNGPDGGPRGLRFRLNYIEDENIFVFQHLFPKFPHLTDLRFEFCSLTYDQVLYVHTFLQQNKQIVHLSLTGNSKRNLTDEECLHLPIQGTHLKLYTLQLCKVDPSVAKLFYYALGKPDRYTRNLVSLNLGCNKLGDKGCALIAGILRGNRFLQTLNISDNAISERALVNLFASLTMFKLSEAELTYKREIKLYELKKKYFPMEKPKRPSYATQSTVSSQTSTGTMDTILYATHPFIIDSYLENEDLYCNGNNTLLHINISYNEITSSLLEIIIDAINYQKRTFKIGGLQRVVAESLKQFPDLMQEINELFSGSTTHRSFKARQSPVF